MRNACTANGKLGVRAAAILTLLLLSGLSQPSGWADGFSGYQRVYTGQVNQNGYPQYFPRIEPDSSYQPTTYQPYNNQPYYNQPQQAASPQPKTLTAKISGGVRDFWKSPSVKSGVAGAGIGLGAAALVEKNLWHGTWVGAAYGVGVGLMDESSYFKKHPMMRRTAKGAVIGLGAATVTGAAALAPAAAVGAGVGLGVHYLKTH